MQFVRFPLLIQFVIISISQYIGNVSEMNLFRTSDRKEWRTWLLQNYLTEKGIWFVFPMKGSGEQSISYNDAVEEALCFGWIDSTIRNIDDMHRAQHFTPRSDKSYYSRPNIERLIWLNENDLLMPEIKEDILPLIEADYDFPKDIISAIEKNDDAFDFYQTLPDGYKRIRIAYIDAARDRPEQFKKRLDHFIGVTGSGKIIRGFGGVDKYYGFDSNEKT